ncbi:MAG: hypothetical protein NW217_16645 [Hyphomicrobiaceae bacterium]|nr:hypothetical protein [Hyphomicrobiaceae bacterium]
MSGMDPFDTKPRVGIRTDARGDTESDVVVTLRQDDDPFDVLHLAELVPLVRSTFALDPAFGDDAILASLKAIAARSSDRDRWSVAFGCNLGRHIGLNSPDPADGLRTLISLLPRPRN